MAGKEKTLGGNERTPLPCRLRPVPLKVLTAAGEDCLPACLEKPPVLREVLPQRLENAKGELTLQVLRKRRARFDAPGYGLQGAVALEHAEHPVGFRILVELA